MSHRSKWRCPYCHAERKSRVLYTNFKRGDVPKKDVLSRRRLCEDCTRRFTTVEISHGTWTVVRQALKLLKKQEEAKNASTARDEGREQKPGNPT